MQDKHKLGIVMATSYEANPFIKGLSLREREKKPFKVYSNEDLALIISGIGKVNAAVAVSYLIWKYNPDLLYNIGVSGGLKPGIDIGDIFHISAVIELDRPRLLDGKNRIVKPDVLKNLEIDKSTLATQDRPVLKLNERKSVSKHADLADMEGASFIQACRLYKKKCYLFKIVSDTIKNENSMQILKNIKRVSKTMFSFFEDNVLNSSELP